MPHALIESLSFGTGTVSPEPAIHILQLLAHSLKSLDVGDASEMLYPLMGTLRFAVLKSLQQNPTTYLHHFHSLSRHTSITELYLGPYTSYRWLIPVDFFRPPHHLPHLQRLSSPWRIAIRIVPGRPVKVFHDTEPVGYDSEISWERLCLLAESTARQGMEEIRICHSTGIIELLSLLNMHVPSLKRLEIFIWDHHPPQGKAWNLRSKSSLIEIEIIFLRPIRESLWLDARGYPEKPCRTFVMKLAEECPKLEQVTFITLNDWPTVDPWKEFAENEQDVPSDCKLKFCKTSSGTWEERLWGTRDEGNMIISL